MNLLNTIQGSLFENFFPSAWDLKKIDECCSNTPEDVNKRESWWHKDFRPVEANSLEDFNTLMGHEIAYQIKLAKDEGRDIIVILSVGPMGMYRWTVEFLKRWNVDCKHVHGFNMDEWCDEEGNTLPSTNPGAFRNAMENALYGPLGNLTVPENQRHFATRDELPLYNSQIMDLRSKGAKFVVIYGIGWVFHIAFWEPHFAADYKNMDEWLQPTHRIAAQLHPLTIIQNSITSFKSRITLVPARANTIGPGIFMKADYTIGGVDGFLPVRNMIYQGMTFWVTLKYGPDMWIPSSVMPQLPGKLFYIKHLAGPLEPDVN
ncbi:MAG: glucosamine-6-phosphate isomerase [Candidatus Atribacteria bacterium]|nr:glucosamine-6-phosphate isomerase [Candidatus Atribacteria bacterium]